jgi:uncharacterized protein YjdB
MKRIPKLLSIFLVLAMLFAFIPATVQASAKPELNKTKATVCVGEAVKLKVTNYASSKVTWTSSNKKIATVTSTGKVKGIKAGKVTITAKVGKKTVKATITVAKHKWTKVEETGHYEEVQTGTTKYIIDGADHGPFYTMEEWQEHRATGCWVGYGVYTRPVYENQWVVETVSYQCARCNQTK